MAKVSAWDRVRMAWAALRLDWNSELPRGGYPEVEGAGRGDEGMLSMSPRAWMSIPAAYAAVNLLSSTMARLPFRVGRVDGAGRFEAVKGHHIAVLLNHPNRLYDRWQFWEGVYRALYAGGNSYCWIRRDRIGNPVELIPAICSSAWWVDDARGYGVRVRRRLQLWGRGYASRQIDVFERDVLSLHGPDFNGMESPSPVRIAARPVLRTMGLSLEHNRRTLEQGVHPKGMIETLPELQAKPEIVEQFKAQLREQFAGVRNAGKTPVLPPGFKWIGAQGGFSAVDLQLLEILKFGVEDIARVFGVPPRLLQHFHEGGRVSQKVEAQAEDFERYSIKPHAQRVGSQMTRKLMSGGLNQVLGMEDLVIEIDTDPLRQGTLSERVATADQLVTKAGIAKIDEGRAIVGLPPLPNGEGDKLLAPKGAPASNASGMEGIDKGDTDE